ncbi:MAG: pyridoxamine 5'-phosphate oxidase family protein [Planctomycetaceae bacterium]|jgi:nitroimidazol reductase NimA-like FMN-containing flavoprotein (pyridoxamine 5'-phosphate oxidase superfamily)|nr:pyridoxamine 5'-phosphate oxidase family protein [Planctomycetaceae bacterium]
MRRKDREILDVDAMLKIIADNKVCRLGLSECDQPYIIPLNYGYSFENNVLTLFFHSANEGKKLEIIKKNNRACFEIDCDGQLIVGKEPCQFGFSFKSVIGTGKIILLNTINEKINALNKLIQHQTGKIENHTFNKNTIKQLTIYKLTVEQFTGKEHPKSAN